MRPAIFYHIPKTAGTSLILMAPEMFASHDPYYTLRREAEGKLQITMLRDPVERVVSWLNFISRPNSREGARLRGRKASDFLAEMAPSMKIWIDERMVRQFGGDWMPTRPQAPMQDQLVRAKGSLAAMDWVGFSNTFDADRPGLMDLLGLPDPGPVHQNVSRYHADIDDAAYDLIAELTQWDQQLYDYAFASGSWPRVS